MAAKKKHIGPFPPGTAELLDKLNLPQEGDPDPEPTSPPEDDLLEKSGIIITDPNPFI